MDEMFGKKNTAEEPEEVEREQTSEAGEDQNTDAAELARLREENVKLRDQALRSLAEVENVRRRSAAERESVIQYANEGLLRELLPIVDDFRRSVESGEKARDFEPFFQGISMINDKFSRLLEQRDVKRITTVGEEFNVELHEALMRQPSDAPEGTIVGEIEPGYTYGGKVIRHARVIVSAGSPAESAE